MVLVLSNTITASQSIFVYVLLWFFRQRPWITLPLSRVHLAVWHHLSAFIDIHLLHLVKKRKEKTPAINTLSSSRKTILIFLFNISANRQPAWQTLETHFSRISVESCLSRNKYRRWSCDKLQKSRRPVPNHQIHSWHVNGLKQYAHYQGHSDWWRRVYANSVIQSWNLSTVTADIERGRKRSQRLRKTHTAEQMGRS